MKNNKLLKIGLIGISFISISSILIANTLHPVLNSYPLDNTLVSIS